MDIKQLTEDEIFNVARKIQPGEARNSYLDQACGGDTAIRERVDILLNAYRNDDSFIEGQAIEIATAAKESVSKLTGTQIGPYKLLEVIGEGGMGTVYMAEQTEPVHRRVALKLIKTGMDTSQVVARFEAERQALAVMDHPNIAKVLDAGSTGSGHPYFVMELVKGKPITQVCDEQQLDTESRLKLFQQVCHAVQHAHQKGIIHRDIKPSNVLVAMYDDRPVPKVIDFGVAKATGEKLTEKTMFTRFGQIVGTLEYMSPEQAQFNQLDIDTRSDIYSLGAILCELLTGEPPFERERLKSQALDETLRMIREEEPTKPSTKLHSSAIASQTATNRSTTTEKLNSIVRGDLDWIVMKALQKDRSQRYETANGLAKDIARHLNDEPVLAGPPNRVYRLRKFARKHKAGVAITIVSLLVLLAGVAGLAKSNSLIRSEQNKTLAAMEKIRQQRDIASAAEAKADARAAELKLVSDFQSEMLEQIDPTVAGVRLSEDVTEKLKAALTKAGLSDADRADQVEKFTKLWRRVNATDAARELIDQTILKPAVAAIDKQFADKPLIGEQLRHVLASRYADLGLHDAALPLQEQALATHRRALGDEHIDTLNSMNNLAVLLGEMGRQNEAEQYMREALEKCRSSLGDGHQETLRRLKSMGAMLHDFHGPTKEAEEYLREALKGQRDVLGDEAEDTLNSMISLADLLVHKGEFSEAEQHLRKAIEGCRNELGEDHRQTLHANDILGLLLAEQGKLSEAEPIRRENLKNRRRVLGEDHPQTLSSMNNLAGVLIDQGKLGEAEPFLREAVDKSRRVLGEEHPQTLNMINNLGYFFYKQEKWNEAETFFRESVNIKRRVLGSEHPYTLISIGNLGSTLRKQSELVEAEELMREAVATGRLIWTNSHPTLVNFIANLGLLLEAQGKYAESAEVLTNLREPAFQAFTGNNQWQYGQVLWALGKAQKGLGDFAAAETNLLEAEALLVQFRGPSQKETIKCTETIVQLFIAWDAAEPDQGYAKKLNEWQRKLAARSQSNTDKAADR